MENAISTLIVACISAILIPALTLTSLIYKPMFENTHDRQDTSPWQQFWGESYRPALKQRLLQPVFSQLERERKIGDVIVDPMAGSLVVIIAAATNEQREPA